MKILFAWIGTADHMACEDEQGTLMGPIGDAVEQLQFAENSMKYQSTLSFLNGKINTLMSAIKGE